MAVSVFVDVSRNPGNKYANTWLSMPSGSVEKFIIILHSYTWANWLDPTFPAWQSQFVSRNNVAYVCVYAIRMPRRCSRN